MILPTLGCGSSPTQLWFQECPCRVVKCNVIPVDRYEELFKQYVHDNSSETDEIIAVYTRLYDKKPSSLVKQLEGPCLGISYALTECCLHTITDPIGVINDPLFIRKALFYSLFDIVRAKIEHTNQASSMNESASFAKIYSSIQKDTYQAENNKRRFLQNIENVLKSKIGSGFTLRLWQNYDLVDTLKNRSIWISSHALFISLQTKAFFFDSSLNVLIQDDNPQTLIECFLNYIKTLRKEYLAPGIIWRFEHLGQNSKPVSKY